MIRNTFADQVLILDGNARSALAATRSLGKRGLRVVVADKTKWTLAGASRYCSDAFVYPSPGEEPDAFVAALESECLRRGIKVIVPMTDLSASVVLTHRDSLDKFTVPFVDFATFDALTNKWKLLELAQRLHISTPATQFVADLSSLPGICASLKFPAVLKPCYSTIRAGERWISAPVRIVSSRRELEEAVYRYEHFRQYPFLIQEHIAGQTQGIFALYDHGKAVAFFGHRRLRERPPWGGVSVLCESIEPNPLAQWMARALLDYAGWHGVAMVEFKITAEGIPYLIEVNGRFWGSLQLGIDAGVDFPWLLYQVSTGREVDIVNGYATGVKCRWLLGDIASLARVLCGNRASLSLSSCSRVQSVFQFLKFFDKTTRYEVNRWEDLWPCVVELGQALWPLHSQSVSRKPGGTLRSEALRSEL